MYGERDYGISADELYQLACNQQRCPDCGGHVRILDEDTLYGYKTYTFRCEKCGLEDQVAGDVVWWKIYEELNKMERKKTK